MKTTLSGRKQRQAGTQLLEFAVVLPLLIFLVMAIVEAGNFITAHEVLNNAAREGARAATNPEAVDYITPGTGSNTLGAAAACQYLNFHKRAFPGWAGNTSCGEPFNIVVEDVPAGDPQAIIVNGLEIPSTRAIVRYNYTFHYVPLLAFFRPNGNSITLRGWAQFRHLY